MVGCILNSTVQAKNPVRMKCALSFGTSSRAWDPEVTKALKKKKKKILRIHSVLAAALSVSSIFLFLC